MSFDLVALFKDGVQEKNSHNRADCSSDIDSVGDGRAVEYYFASDARWDTNIDAISQIIEFLSVMWL